MNTHQISIKNWLLLAAIVCGLGTILTSCKDDDKLSEEEKQQKQDQEADEQFLLTSDFWKVAGQLSTAEVLPDDWQNATFEPGIGQPSDKSSTTRIVLTNEAEAAAESFKNLTGADVSNSDIYEWKREFGTLTYKKSHDGQSWATVDVDIKQMPGLKRIVYCTPDQQGLNANVPGTPYYRFGDVIKKQNADKKWEYWVCVRPCFGPEKKGDSHWMCLGSLPESNIKQYEHDTRKWCWPKSLTTNDEHIKNLSEMTYAILNPEKWEQYYNDNKKKYMFHDFSYKNISYHNRYFWELVQDAWNEPLSNEGGQTVFQLLFHRTMDDVKADNQLRFFYGSGSGPGLFSWNISITTALVTFPSFRLLTTQNHKKSGDKYSFDIHEYSETGRADNSTYFNENGKNPYIYPLRYLRGDKLFGSESGYYQPMDGSNGIQDVYVFNKRYEQKYGNNYDMKSFNSKADKEDLQGIFNGLGFYRIGDVLTDEDGSNWFCIQAAGKGSENIDTTLVKEDNLMHFNKAWFISLSPGNFIGTGQYRCNLPTVEQALSIGYSLSSIYYQITYRPGHQCGAIIEHIKKNALVDIKKIVVVRDSLYDSSDPKLNQPNKKHQPNFFTNIAYSSPDHEKRNVQPLLRFILHNCALDVKNNEVQWNSRINAFEAWTRYKTGDKDEMLLQDLINMDKVNMYAANDEWVTLPWYSTETNGQITNPYQKPRTGRYGNIQCRDFDWNEKEMNYNDSNKCSMYNEPIVFLRVLAIHDTGKQELISTDGRQLTVKSLIDKVAGSKYSRQDDFFGANDNYLMMNVRFREMKWNGVEQQGLYLSEIKLK